MFLYLVQHGEARKEEEDPARGLTDKGLQDVRKVAAIVQKTGLRVNQIFHSGKTRALQTAQIFADFLKPEEGIAQTDKLAPMDEPAVWGERLSAAKEDIMLVGHLPHLAGLAGLLLCRGGENIPVDFKMGGIVCLKRFDDGRWALEWMIVPEMIVR